MRSSFPCLRCLVAGCIVFLAAWLPIRSRAAASDQEAVLAPIHAMFDGMAKRDAAAIQQTTMPGGSLVMMRDGKPTQMTFAAFAAQVSKPSKTKIEERIYKPVVRIDGDLAMVWAPFDFLTDGKVNHCGTDLFNLVKTDGKWLITAIADTGHAECPTR